MRVLLVEDDLKISTFVKIGLESNDFIVDLAYNSQEAEKLALSRKYDIMILDIVIPGISGFELCKVIRNNNILTPIILLTSLDSIADKLEGFDCGADDYMIKPFIFQELLARINALNRRVKSTSVKPSLKIADLEVDSIRKKVRRGGNEIVLTAIEYRILELLIENKEKVFDRISIAEKIWGFSFNSGTNVIDVHLASLRKKIDKDFDIKLIHTRRGLGFVISENG